MDRRTWLEERRAAMIAGYDTQASTYDEHPYPAEAQGRFVDRLVETCRVAGVILDAPCGTGRYFARIATAGRRVVGIDQSRGMLEQARVRGIAEALHRLGLQELAFEREFDGVMTVDAMEHVFPEDWPLVLANLQRAVRPNGHLYITVEEFDGADIDAAFTALQASGLPAVHGEVVEGETGGYHYYPGRERVLGWLADASLGIVAEETQHIDNWGYWHLFLRAR